MQSQSQTMLLEMRYRLWHFHIRVSSSKVSVVICSRGKRDCQSYGSTILEEASRSVN